MADTTTHDYLCDPEIVADLATTYYNQTFSAEDVRVIEACRNASSRFRAAVRHPVTNPGPQQFILDGTGTRYVQLPVLNPVIERVSIHGEPTKTRVSRRGILEFNTVTPRNLEAIDVSILSSGLETVPEEITGPVTWAALLRVGQYPGVQSIQVGAMSAVYGATGTTIVTEEWSQAVSNYQIQRGDRA
ncbi:hypothetical protein [Kocuria sp. TGY1127_2]|uniref:hypothetical protein n=1 Tax=Kocuria sp. TGY1127_2 TaxID=2711328 RepID=UPI0015BB5953|nr:hypothetical protein [Kocuria sp. TGY1127_2]